MINGQDNIHEALEKLAYAYVLPKPFHEMSDKEVSRLRRNFEEEKKTPERKVRRGLASGLGGVVGGTIGAGLGAVPAADAASKAGRGVKWKRISAQNRRRIKAGGAIGALAGAGGISGLSHLSDYLTRRRIGREAKRRGLKKD